MSSATITLHLAPADATQPRAYADAFAFAHPNPVVRQFFHRIEAMVSAAEKTATPVLAHERYTDVIVEHPLGLESLQVYGRMGWRLLTVLPHEGKFIYYFACPALSTSLPHPCPARPRPLLCSTISSRT